MKSFPRLALKRPGALRLPRSLGAHGLDSGLRLRLRPASPLMLALLAAVVLHLLGLSYGHLRTQRQPLQPPVVADDSPELLVFSRRQPLEEQLQTVAIPALANLPPLASLPPPPPPEQPLAPAQASSPIARAEVSHPRRVIRLQGHPISASPKRPPSPARSSRSIAAAPSPRVSGSALAVLSHLQGVGEAPEPKANAEGDQQPELEIQHPVGEAAASWRKLWKRASPVSPAAPGQGPAGEGLELRRSTLVEARADGLNPGERMALALDERLMLLWPDGPTLWIWRAPLTGHPEPPGTKS